MNKILLNRIAAAMVVLASGSTFADQAVQAPADAPAVETAVDAQAGEAATQAVEADKKVCLDETGNPVLCPEDGSSTEQQPAE